ncbi:MAG: type IV pilus secretin PilQ [Pseudomonadales bacterium]
MNAYRGIVAGARLRWLTALSLLFCMGAQGATLERIEFSSLPGDRTEIRMQFDMPPPQPTGYTIERPARIALDLEDVTSTLESKYHSLGIGNARSVTVIEAGDRTRVIVNLAELVPYTSTVEGNTLFVLVGVDSQGAAIAATPDLDIPMSEDDRLLASDSQILDIDFRRGEEGEGRVVITLSDPTAPVDIHGEGGNIRVEIGNTALPPNLRRRLDVVDFATPVQIIDAVAEAGNVVITIQPTGDYDYLAYQADETLTVNVRPVTPDDRETADDVFRFKGEKLSLNFQDIEVRSVLQLIADFTDLNLVASDTVSGRITLRLKNVPWDQALDLILKTKGLDKRQIGNVLLVAPASEIAAREKLELENRRQISELAPLRTDFIQVRYASASEIFDLFSNTAGGEGGPSVLSERGSVIVDERTNSIILTDTAENLEEFRRILARLDVPVRQVLIEARIVNAQTNMTEELGIRWGGGGFESVGNKFLKIGGSLNTLGELQDGIVTGSTEIGFPDALVVDLGVSGEGSSSVGIGLTGSNFLLDLELSAIATDGFAEVVARPKVITADKQAATILSGVEIPFQEASSSGATSTSFKEAVLSLEVTPQITPDDRIIMDLKVNQDSVGQVFNGVPSINTTEITTQVLVEDGQTIVLGGIFQTSTNMSSTKTPFLGDLPYVGRLFRRTVESDDRQELLVFITPRIMRDALSSR